MSSGKRSNEPLFWLPFSGGMMIDACLWPALRAAFETWLQPDNFDAAGQQRRSLSSLTAPLLVAKG